MHPIGQERTQPIHPAPQTKWTGDFPSGDPTDWFESAEEYYAFVEYDRDDDDNELLENERLIDEW
jgi:hypothetical protein